MLDSDFRDVHRCGNCRLNSQMSIAPLGYRRSIFGLLICINEASLGAPLHSNFELDRIRASLSHPFNMGIKECCGILSSGSALLRH